MQQSDSLAGGRTSTRLDRQLWEIDDDGLGPEQRLFGLVGWFGQVRELNDKRPAVAHESAELGSVGHGAAEVFSRATPKQTNPQHSKCQTYGSRRCYHPRPSRAIKRPFNSSGSGSVLYFSREYGVGSDVRRLTCGGCGGGSLGRTCVIPALSSCWRPLSVPIETPSEVRGGRSRTTVPAVARRAHFIQPAMLWSRLSASPTAAAYLVSAVFSREKALC